MYFLCTATLALYWVEEDAQGIHTVLGGREERESVALVRFKLITLLSIDLWTNLRNRG
jgi:hypothetical protein